MNLREVREAAERIYVSGATRFSDGVFTIASHILSTIDPSPDEPITAEWLREEWGWDNYGTMSMHYDHDEYTAFCWRESDGLSFVAKSHQLRCYTTEFPVHTRQQFSDLAKALNIQRRTKHAIEPKGCTCLDSPNMLYAPCSYCNNQRKDGVK